MNWKLPTYFRPLCALAAILLASGSASALSFQLNSNNLTASETATASAALHEVQSILPDIFKRNLGKVTIEFKKLESKQMGLARVHAIALNLRLLSADGALEKLLKPVLVHEISHVYDFANIPDPRFAHMQDECRNPGSIQSKECNYLRGRNRSISLDWNFLRAAGWIVDESTNRLRPGNNFETRSPNYSEFKNTDESFAVNMEFFLLDPEFKCRKPSIYKSLQALLKHDPFPQKACDSFTDSVFVSSYSDQVEKSFLKIPRERLYQIHWLHAGEGAGAMSRYGHSMLRLVICAPQKPLNDDCLKDTSYHLVVTFRASVEDGSIESLKGLKGDYPSILFMQTFPAVFNEYTRDEFRTLHSYPLKLNRQQMFQVLDSTLELHWSYQGQYFFLSNNCAVETTNLLKKSLGSESLFQRLNSVRPDVLVQQLHQENLIDTSATPLLHKSKRSEYESYLENLKTAGLISSEVTLENWLDFSEANRSQWIEKTLRKNERSLLSDFYNLESRGFSILRRKINAAAAAEMQSKMQIARQTNSQSTNVDERKITTMKVLLARFRSPGHLLGTKGYGRPLQSELESFLNSAEIRQLTIEKQKSQDEMQESLSNSTPDSLRSRLKMSSELLQRLGESLTVKNDFTLLLNKIANKKE